MAKKNQKKAAPAGEQNPEDEFSKQADSIEENSEGPCEEVSEVEVLKESVEGLEKELEEYKGKYLRKHADFENFRKRMLREKEDSIKYANASLLKDLVSVIDDFERAISSAQESMDYEIFLSGIKLIEKQFTAMLENNWGLKRMDTVGEEFDPQMHEALMMEEDADCSTETVLEDYQKGYVLHDRVIRHAKVKVGRPTVEAAAPASE